MDGFVHTLLCKGRWKIHMLLRSKKSFNTVNPVMQYKQPVLSFVEYQTAAIYYHAATTILQQLDSLQNKLLCNLMDFNVDSLSM